MGCGQNQNESNSEVETLYPLQALAGEMYPVLQPVETTEKGKWSVNHLHSSKELVNCSCKHSCEIMLTPKWENFLAVSWRSILCISANNLLT